MTTKKQWIAEIETQIDVLRGGGKMSLSHEDVMVVALLDPVLYGQVMPKKYRHDPIGAQMVLPTWKRNFVWNRRTLY